MRSAHRIPRLTAAALLACLAAGSASAQNVLKQIPDDAGLAVVVPNLNRLAASLMAFGKAIDVKDLEELNAEKMLLETVDSTDGINADDGFAMAVSPRNDSQPLLLCTLSDAAAWKKSSGAAPDAEAEGLLAVVVQGDDMYAAIKGDVLMLSESAAMVRAAMNSKGKFAAAFAKSAGSLAGDSQILLYIDVPVWRTKVDEGLGMAEMMLPMLLGNIPGPAQNAQTSVAFIKFALSELRGLIHDARSVVLAARIGSDGVRITEVLGFDEKSKTAAYLKSAKKSDKDLLRGLPDLPFAMAFAYDWETPPDAPTFSEKMLDVVSELLPADDAEKKQLIKKGLDKARSLYRRISGINFALAAPPEGAGMIFWGAYLSKNPTAVQKEMTELMTQHSDLMGALSMGVQTEIVHESGRVADTPVEIYKFKITSDDPMANQMMQQMYGDTPTMYTVVKGSELLYVMGPAEEARKRLEQNLSGKLSGLSTNKRLSAANATISPNPQAVFYIDVAQLAEFAAQMAAMGAPVPEFKISKQVPLVAGGCYLEAPAFRGELFVPAACVREIVAASKSAPTGGEQ